MTEENPELTPSAIMQGSINICDGCEGKLRKDCIPIFWSLGGNTTLEAILDCISGISAVLDCQNCKDNGTLHVQAYARVNSFLQNIFESARGSQVCNDYKFTAEMRKLLQVVQKHNLTAKIEQKIRIPIIHWEEVPFRVEFYPGKHQFESKYKGSSVMKQRTIKLDELTLSHATSSVTLASIVSDTNPFVLKTNIHNDSNTTSSGLLFCGVALPFRKSVKYLPKFLSENRYGSCLIEFQAPWIDNPTARLYRLGTKFYVKEFCQAVLVDTQALHRTYGVFSPTDKKITICDELTRKYQWELEYEKYETGKWTNPEIVFPHDMKLLECEGLKITFVDHHDQNCRTRNNCYDCRCEQNGQCEEITARMHTEGTEEVEDVTFLKSGKFTFPKTRIGRVIMVFALSLNSKKREELRILQKERAIFKDTQFKAIEAKWKRYKDCFYTFED